MFSGLYGLSKAKDKPSTSFMEFDLSYKKSKINKENANNPN